MVVVPALVPAVSDHERGIAALVDALKAGHPPPLAWIGYWSQEGGDPVMVAWNSCASFFDMLALLELLDRAAFARARAATLECERGLREMRPAGGMVDAVRSVVVAPTLDQVLARVTNTTVEK